MKYKAIIFDLDGTIVNTVGIWKKTNQILLERRGIVLSPEQELDLSNRIHSLALPQSCSIIKNMMNFAEPIEKIVAEKSQIAMSLYREGVSFIEGFEAFHKLVVQLQLHKAIATNADDTTIQETDTALNLKKFFGEHIYGISAVNMVCKPDPAVYLHAADKLQVDPNECLAIEDSAHGIAAAQKAGMLCIGISAGSSSDQVKGADHIVERYQDIDIHTLLKK